MRKHLRRRVRTMTSGRAVPGLCVRCAPAVRVGRTWSRAAVRAAVRWASRGAHAAGRRTRQPVDDSLAGGRSERRAVQDATARVDDAVPATGGSPAAW